MTITLYERDFYQWLEHTARLVRDGRLGEIDHDILIDELESMGKRDKRELSNRLIILIAHLLKWQFQSDVRSPSWIGSIAEQRLQIAGQLEDSPSLKNFLGEAAEKAYPRAVVLASKEMGKECEQFPPACPFALSELLDDDFFPES